MLGKREAGEFPTSPRLSSPMYGSPRVRSAWDMQRASDALSHLEHQLKAKDVAYQKLTSEMREFLKQLSLRFHCHFETLEEAMEMIGSKQAEFAMSAGDITRQLRETASDLKQTQMEKESLQRELTRQRAMETTHKKNVASLNREIVEKDGEIEALNRSVKQLQIRVKAEHIKKKLEAETTMSEVEALRQQNEKLSAELSTVQDHSLGLIDSLEAKDQAFAEASAQLQELEKRVDENNAKIQSLAQEIAAKDEELVKVKEEEAKMKEEMASVAQRLAESETKIVQLNEEIAKKDRELQDADDMNRSFSEEIAKKNELMASKDGEINESLEKVKELEEKLAKSDDEVRRLTEEIARKDEEVSQVREQERSIHTKMEVLEQQLHAAEEKIGGLNSQLTQRDAELASAMSETMEGRGQMKQAFWSPGEGLRADPMSNRAGADPNKMSQSYGDVGSPARPVWGTPKQIQKNRTDDEWEPRVYPNSVTRNIGYPAAARQQLEKGHESDELDRLCQERARAMKTLGKGGQPSVGGDALGSNQHYSTPTAGARHEANRDSALNRSYTSPSRRSPLGGQSSPTKQAKSEFGPHESNQFAKAVFEAVQGLNISSGKEYATLVSNLIHTGMILQQQTQRAQEQGMEQRESQSLNGLTETHIPSSDSSEVLTAVTDSAMHDQIEYLWEENKDLTAEIKRLEQDAATKEQEWSTVVSSKEKKLRMMRQKVEKLESTIQRLQSDVVACHQTIESQEQRIEQEKSSNDSLKQKLNETKSVAKYRKQQLRSAEDEKAEVIKGIRQRSEDIQARYDKVIAKLEGELEQAQSDYKRMSDELTETQAAKDSLVVERAKLYVSEKALKMKLESLSNALERSQEEYQTRKDEMYSAFQDTIGAKNQEIDKYKAIIQGIVGRFTTTPMKTTDLSEACAIINTGIDRMVKQKQAEAERKWKSSQDLAQTVRRSFY